MIGIGAHAVADQFGQNRRAAAAGELQLLQNENAGAFTHDESVAVLVPGTAGALRFVVARGQRPHGGESADAHRRDGRFGAAGDHHIGIAALDDLEGIADGMRAGGAGRGRGFIRALGAVTDADVAGRQVDDRRGNEEGRDLARAAFQQRLVLALDDVKAADARADVHAHAGRDFRRHLQPRSLHGLIRRRQADVDEAAHLLQLFFLDEIQRIEILDFGRNLAGKLGGVEVGDPAHAALAGEQARPHFPDSYFPRRRSIRSR